MQFALKRPSHFATAPRGLHTSRGQKQKAFPASCGYRWMSRALGRRTHTAKMVDCPFAISCKMSCHCCPHAGNSLSWARVAPSTALLRQMWASQIQSSDPTQASTFLLVQSHLASPFGLRRCSGNGTAALACGVSSCCVCARTTCQLLLSNLHFLPRE